MNRQYCLERVSFHEKMQQEYLSDAETALTESVGKLKTDHYDSFMKSADTHREHAERWKALAAGEME